MQEILEKFCYFGIFYLENCSDKIHQAGGVAAPVGGQILSEVLPYMEIKKDNEEEKDDETQIEVPELRGKTVEEAEKIVKDLQIELEINEVDIKELNKKETIIKEQLPKPGVKILNNKKIYVDIES